MWKQQQLRCGAEEEEDGKEGGKAAKVVEERAELLWGTEPCAGRAYIEAGAAGRGQVVCVCVECAAVESANQENGAVTRQRQRQLRLSSD